MSRCSKVKTKRVYENIERLVKVIQAEKAPIEMRKHACDWISIYALEIKNRIF